MEFKQAIELRQQIKPRLIRAGIGLSLVFFSMLGMWKLSPGPFMEQQENLQKIRKSEVRYFDLNFANTQSGNLQNEGTIHFGGDITNYGRMGCGSCKSGLSFVGNLHDSSIVLKGTNPIEMYESVVSSLNDLHIQTEWKIRHKLIVRQGQLKGDKAQSSHFVHLGEGASVEFNPSGPNYIDGWVGRTGKGELLFPLGNSRGSRSLLLRGWLKHSFFKACFVSVEDRLEGGILTGIPLFTAEGKYKIVEQGLWLIEGNEASEISFETELDESLIVLGWRNGKWENLGGSMVGFGTRTEGAVVPNDFEAFTLGREIY